MTSTGAAGMFFQGCKIKKGGIGFLKGRVLGKKQECALSFVHGGFMSDMEDKRM